MAKRFDLFLSHHSIDRPWVLRLKKAVEARGLTVWLDRDEIRPGDLFVNALERGLTESRAVGLVASPESLRSGWVQEEYARALALTKDGSEPIQLIPMLLRDVELPGFLAGRSWVDFREDALFERSLDQLMWGVTGRKPRASSARPLKRKALLDRRLAAELIVSYRADDTRRVDARSRYSNLYALSVFENVLIENQFGSVLAALVKDEELLSETVLFIGADSQTEPDELSRVPAEISGGWAADPGFQVAASVYGRSKGNTGEGPRDAASYLERLLVLARRFDAAIIPHPDRWPLLEHLFEHSLQAIPSGEWARVAVGLPDPSEAAREAISARRSAQLDQLSGGAQAPAPPGFLVRYGPMAYPVLATPQPITAAALAALPAFTYELCTTGRVERAS